MEEQNSEISQNNCNADVLQQRLAEDMAMQEQQVDASLTDDVSQASESQSALEEALATAEKNKDLYMRAVADLDTYKRKVQREKAELAKFALQPLIEELLPSMDHLDMAIQAAYAVENGKNIALGVEMVRTQIKNVFASFGVEEISAQGQVFDPNQEDCVSNEPSDTVAENHVIKVVRTGYKMNGRLLRPASVVVSSGKAK